MRVCWDGAQLRQSNSSSLLATSPPPALMSDSWTVLITSPQHVPINCLRAVQVKERMEAEGQY